jgi:hypothetical protein
VTHARTRREPRGSHKPYGAEMATSTRAIQWHVCSWRVTFEQARDSRKTGVWPIWLVTGMCSIGTTNAGRARIGSCSPHTEPRDCHSGPADVARSRSIVTKNGYNSIGGNSAGSLTHRNTLEIISARNIVSFNLGIKSVHVMHPIKFHTIFWADSSPEICDSFR